MSRVGKLPVIVPKGLEAKVVEGNNLILKKGNTEISYDFGDKVTVVIEDGAIKVARVPEKCKNGMFAGLHRNKIRNLVVGLTDGFQQVLQLSGTGYKASTTKGLLVLSLGYSHDIFYALPQDINVEVDAKTNDITIKGIDKEMVGQVTAEIISFRKPEPYKGHGVLKKGVEILRKEGKKK